MSAEVQWLQNSVLNSENTPYRHPLEVGSNSIHLALINANTWPVVAERLFGVVESAKSVPVSIVRYLCMLVSDGQTASSSNNSTVIIPSGNPSEVLRQKLQVRVRAILYNVVSLLVRGFG